jgi:hypothetical protein
MVRALQEQLEFEDRRGSTPPLVNYWFKTEGGGWVRPDWRRIAEIAVDSVLADLRDDAPSP